MHLIETYLSITALFQQSVQSGTLPGAWNEAWVTPVSKKGNRNDQSQLQTCFTNVHPV